MAPGVSGTWLRVTHGESARPWIGSSMVQPQHCWPNPEPGSTSVAPRASGSAR